MWLLRSSFRAMWLILTITVMLAVLSGDDSIFFTPKKTVSGLVYLRRRDICPCSVQLSNLIHNLLVILIAKLRKHLYWTILCTSQLGMLCILKMYVGGRICTLSSCSASEKSERSTPWLTTIWCDYMTGFFWRKRYPVWPWWNVWKLPYYCDFSVVFWIGTPLNMRILVVSFSSEAAALT